MMPVGLPKSSLNIKLCFRAIIKANNRKGVAKEKSKTITNCSSMPIFYIGRKKIIKNFTVSFREIWFEKDRVFVQMFWPHVTNISWVMTILSRII
jgi:hypothetical protein